MTKFQLLQWMLNSCVGFIPVYFVLDMVALYGYLRLHYLGKRVYKSYLIASIILTLVLLVNCVAIWVLSKLV